MGELSLLPEVAADLRLADSPPERQGTDRAFRPSHMFFSSGQSVSGLLSTVRPICVRAL
jgi:hypothetical protein